MADSETERAGSSRNQFMNQFTNATVIRERREGGLSIRAAPLASPPAGTWITWSAVFGSLTPRGAKKRTQQAG